MCAQKLSFDYAHTLHTVRIVHNAHSVHRSRVQKGKSCDCINFVRATQPPCRGRNADKGISDGLECIGGEPRGFYGAVDGTAAELEPIGRLSGREVHRIHRWGRTFDGDGCGLHAENTGPHQGF